MEKSCEFCAESRPVVYCNSDASFLCLLCDARVHSANALSERHLRSLICEGCKNHPASIRCLDHSLFLCHLCDQNLHETSAHHQKRVIQSYSGCPSARDFAVSWGYELGDNGSLVPGMVSLGILREFGSWIEGSSSVMDSLTSIFSTDSEVGSSNSQSKILHKTQQQQNTGFILQQILGLEKLQLTWINNHSSFIHEKVKTDISSSDNNTSAELSEDLDQKCQNPQNIGFNLQHRESLHHKLQVQSFHLPFSQMDHLNSSSSATGIPFQGETLWQCKSPPRSSQLWSQNMQDLGICEEIDCCDDFKMPDVDLTFQNYEDLFEGDQDQTRVLFDDQDLACSSIGKDVSLVKSDNCYPRIIEDISLAPSVCITQSAIGHRNIGPFDQAHRFDGSLDSPYPYQPSYSTLSSLSRFSGENNACDYLDSGVSPNIIKGEPPWNSPDIENAHSEARENAMMRYKKKQKVRMHEKQILYASRKARADVRKRVKERFVTAT